MFFGRKVLKSVGLTSIFALFYNLVFWVFKYLEGMQQMATIKDVARDAGVSVGTVSNVLNGGKVSAER